MTHVDIRRASAADLANSLDDLTDILHASVHAGASVGFILPFSRADASDFWRGTVFPPVRSGQTHLFLAHIGTRVVGTVQLGLALPPNQPHRADVAKMLVHPDMRRRGIARRLLGVLEQEARALGKTLLVLDTRTGDSAQPLYASEGFEVAGVIPGYCRDPAADHFDSTTYMFKALE